MIFLNIKNNKVIKYLMENKQPNLKDFVEREFNDFIEGEYDELGFFNTPNGSFWDPDGVYFNREGFDKHGGYYDDNNEYQPGEGWDETRNCYIDELNDYDYDDEYGSDHDDDEDDGFGEIDMDKIQDEELLIKNMEGIEKEKIDPDKYGNNFEKEVDYPKQNKEEKEEDKKEDNKKEKEKEEEKKEEEKPSKLKLLLESIGDDEKKKKKKKGKKGKKKEKTDKEGNTDKKKEDNK